MDGLEIAAIATPAGAAYLAVTLLVARAAYRSLDSESDSDVFWCFVIGLLWPVVLPIFGIYKFITAPPKDGK